MHQILFHLPQWLPFVGGAPIYGYGVMLVIGFFAAMQLAMFMARRSGIDPEIFVNAGLIALVTGVIGARMSHVLETWSDFSHPDLTAWENFRNMINIRSGGLTFYGGFLLATPCTIAYGLYKKVPIRRGMDIVAPCLMVGLGFGRIGCFLNGCCYGAECDKSAIPWAVHFPYYSNPYLEEFEQQQGKRLDHNPLPQVLDGKSLRPPATVPEAVKEQEHSNWLHPAQLYSTITAWLIAGILVACYTLPHPPGRVFALMLLIESPTRFLLEMLRAEPPVVGRGSNPPHLTFLPPWSFSMVLSVVLFLAGVVLWYVFRGPPDDLRQPAVEPRATPAAA